MIKTVCSNVNGNGVPIQNLMKATHLRDKSEQGESLFSAMLRGQQNTIYYNGQQNEKTN